MTDTAPVISVKTTLGHEDWKRAFSAWVELKPVNTARAYRTAWNQLFLSCGKTPWEISREDVSSWVESMSARGLAAATIAQRLAAISSFFTYLRDTRWVQCDNPAGSKVLRPKTELYSGARFLTAADARALLGVMNRNTAQGSRDFALFLTYLFTGRRNSEIRSLQWGDIELDGARVFYRWKGKGKARRDELPRPCFEAIEQHLRMTGRLGSMRADDFIFLPIGKGALNLPNYQADEEAAPLSMHQVEDLLKGYTRRAGITTRIRVHDLRHSAAMLRRSAGDDVLRISEFLGHSNLAITQVYLHRIEGRQDTSWQTVGELLGIGVLGESHVSRIAKNHVRTHQG
jgi:site-specific recombinase XerD